MLVHFIQTWLKLKKNDLGQNQDEHFFLEKWTVFILAFAWVVHSAN
jgi:hypothetical protein